MELCTLAHGSTTCLSLTSTDNPSLFVTPGWFFVDNTIVIFMWDCGYDCLYM